MAKQDVGPPPPTLTPSSGVASPNLQTIPDEKEEEESARSNNQVTDKAKIAASTPDTVFKLETKSAIATNVSKPNEGVNRDGNNSNIINPKAPIAKVSNITHKAEVTTPSKADNAKSPIRSTNAAIPNHDKLAMSPSKSKVVK